MTKEHLDLRVQALEHRLLAEMDQRFAMFTRTFVLANAGLLLTSTSLAFAAARFA